MPGLSLAGYSWNTVMSEQHESSWLDNKVDSCDLGTSGLLPVTVSSAVMSLCKRTQGRMSLKEE